jgi:hypothetical protein
VSVKLVLDNAALERELRGPNGMVAEHVINRATVVQLAARVQAPKRTGCLAASIVKRPTVINGEFAMAIVADTTPCSPTRTNYALFVHEGTRPHVITARSARALSFEWQGKRVFFKTVHHPGTKANRFLTDNLPLAVA